MVEIALLLLGGLVGYWIGYVRGGNASLSREEAQELETTLADLAQKFKEFSEKEKKS